VISALLIGAIRKPEPPPVPATVRPPLHQEIAEGLRMVVRSPILRALAGCSLVAHMSFRVFGAVFLLYVTRELGFAPGTQGMIWAVGGVSSLVASVLAGRVAGRLGFGRAMIAGVALMGCSMMLIPMARDASLAALAFLIGQQLGDGGFTVYEITQTSLRQTITPDRLLGRVVASTRFAALAAMLAGSLAGGVLGETLGLRWTLVAAATGVLLSTLWLVCSPLRRLVRPEEAYV
jgi:predicted MFS family arabinose efflux permease